MDGNVYPTLRRTDDPRRMPLADVCDDSVIALIMQHDEQALATLYNRYKRRVTYIAYRITRNPETAEEVVQDVFQHVWQSAGSFQRERATVATWLQGIVRHRAIDVMRSKRENARAREELLDQTIPAPAESNPECSIAQAVLCTMVRTALTKLPASQRHVIELTYDRDMTSGAIAAIVGAPVGTIKTRLRLGLGKLRLLLQELAEE